MSAERAPLFPAMLDVAGRLAVVVGAGVPAVRSAKSLAASGADVVVISPDVGSELAQMEADGLVTLEARGYVRGDLEGAMLAVVASGDAETDAAVAAEARERNVLVNALADATGSDFIVPSVVRRGDLQIAVSTAGLAPSVTREVRATIARTFRGEWADYVRFVAQLRTIAVMRDGLSEAQLAPLFASVMTSGVRERLAGGEDVDAVTLYEAWRAATESAGTEGGIDPTTDEESGSAT